MKKVIYYLFFYAVFCLLQFFFGRYLNIGGVFPNFILIAVVYLGLSRGKMGAQTMGFLYGLTWDSFSTDVFGVRAIMFTLIGYFSGALSKNFDKDQIFAQITLVVAANIIYWLGFSLLYFVIPDGAGSYKPFVVSVYGSLKIFFTVLITPVVFFALNAITNRGRKYF
ncbi:MAG: rod shape-determining protein MreD [Endomicrobium sp.]|jgi:rod shape-determining protein MreD|nr:rod shape-determining protein MreD [Endomicrobium sp.]